MVTCRSAIASSKDRSLAEPELAAAFRALVQHHRPGHVRRHQVRRELDAHEAGVDRLGEGADQHRLADAGDPLEQPVPAGDQAGEDQIDHLAIADDAFGESVAERFGHLGALLHARLDLLGIT
jgi:hypothetical protein